MSLPAPIIEEGPIGPILRDDRLPGGSKRRALPAVISRAPDGPLVYAGPCQGYAQLALAHAAADAGRRAICYVAHRQKPHALTLAAEAAGAAIVTITPGYLAVVRAQARRDWGECLLPLGFDQPPFIAALAGIARALPIEPAEVWCVAGSGALSRSLQAAWPEASHHAVQIGKLPEVGKARLWKAAERFEQPAKEPPPFPSSPGYDAKAWAIMRRVAKPGAFFWNVGA